MNKKNILKRFHSRKTLSHHLELKSEKGGNILLTLEAVCVEEIFAFFVTLDAALRTSDSLILKLYDGSLQEDI